jgi:hypothetical protein
MRFCDAPYIEKKMSFMCENYDKKLKIFHILKFEHKIYSIFHMWPAKLIFIFEIQ